MKVEAGIYVLIAYCASSCVTPFPAPNIDNNKGFLVVNSFVDISKQRANVTITRSISLSSSDSPPPEAGATVTIVDGLKNEIRLNETQPGVYESTGNIFKPLENYRLRIITPAGALYESTPAIALPSPQIDSIVWRATPDGVTIYGNATDSFNSSRYYIWNFQETWEYTAIHLSNFKYEGEIILPRGPGDFIYTCWSSASSSKVLISSSSRLGENQISDFALRFIEKGSPKISKKYSLLARLRAISEDEYNYWLQVQKTNDNLGGIFDPLPSQVSGNIINVQNPAEPVIGYFAVGEVSEQRLFVELNELPISLFSPPSRQGCDLRFIGPGEFGDYFRGNLIVRASQMPEPPGWYITERSCADCRFQGGTTERPFFWK